MMWIVRLALRRPYTFVVFALLILILGVFSIESMPTDIFPNIDIPVVTVVWGYGGMSADQMANRIVSNAERSMTTTVSDIDHIESQSLVGIAIIKVFFHPSVNIGSAVAEITAVSQVQVRSLPPGTFPPFIIQYNASSVPVLQLGMSGQGLNEQQLNDLASNTIRTQLATIEGAQIPFPFGGKQRQIQVDLDLKALQARGLSPADVVSAIGAQNVIAPSGTIKLDRFEYQVETNSAPTVIDTLNNLPIKAVNGAVIYIRDVAHVRDGNPPQTNIVRVDGRRAIMMNVMKTGSASTLDIIKGVRQIIFSPSMKGQLPPQMKIVALADQSIFVRGAINGVVREAIIAACLTAIMILVFLGSWRSTIIIAVSIPLSILCSLILLYALHETINIMTLGGMALAVGILVDDATVAIENINRNLETGQGAGAGHSGRLGADCYSRPGVDARHLHRLCAHVPSERRGALPVCAHGRGRGLRHAGQLFALAHPGAHHGQVPAQGARRCRERAKASQPQSIHAFPTRLRSRLREVSPRLPAPAHLLRGSTPGSSCSCSWYLPWPRWDWRPWLGQDFFPSVDSGQFKIHVRAHTGTRIEETAALCDHVDATIREQIPANEVVTILDNIGLPYSALNLSYSTSAPVGPSDADIQVQLSRDHHPTEAYVERLRAVLAREYPGVTFYVRAGRHRHADSQLRPCRAHRYSDRRPQSLWQPRPGRAHAE